MLRGLHKSCDKAQWDAALTRLSAPSARTTSLERQGWGQWTPLHLAAKRSPPLAVTLALLDAAPETVDIKDGTGRIPLHHAAEWGAADEVLVALVEGREGLGTTDDEGRTALHCALAGCHNDSQARRDPPQKNEIELLLGVKGGKSGMEVASVADLEGNLPLHLTCESVDAFRDSQAVETIVKAFPGAVTMRNSEGRTPLHIALSKCEESPPDLHLVRLLLGFAPDSTETESSIAAAVTRMEDGDGKLPLHCACRAFASFEVLNEILAHFPAGAAVKSRDGLSEENEDSPLHKAQYPLDILEEMRDAVCSVEETEEMNYKSDLLFAHYPNVTPHDRDDERLQRLKDLIIYEAGVKGPSSSPTSILSPVARQIWVWMCTTNDSLYTSHVQSIIDSLRDSNIIRVLAEVRTADGEAVRNVSSPGVRHLLQPLFRFADRYVLMGPSPSDEEKGMNAHLRGVVKRGERTLWIRAVDYGLEGSAIESPRDVVLHFTSDAGAFSREVAVYNILSNTPGLVPLLNAHSVERVGTRDEKEGDAAFARGVRECVTYDLSDYGFVCVYPSDEGCLDDYVKREEMSTEDVRELFKIVLTGLKSVHDKGLIHGNLLSENIVRYRDTSKSTPSTTFCLTSLATAKPFSDPLATLHITPSTSTLPPTSLLPPEAFTSLTITQRHMYESYFKTIKDDSSTYASVMQSLCDSEVDALGEKVDGYLRDMLKADGIDRIPSQQATFEDLWGRVKSNAFLWNVLRPHENEETKECVVIKTFAAKTDEDDVELSLSDKLISPERLPYKPVALSPSTDLFGVGLLLYKLVSSQTVSPVSSQGHLTSDSSYLMLTQLTSKEFDEYEYQRLMDTLIPTATISDPVLRDLLRNLLAPSSHRLKSVDDVLAHPYFASDDPSSLHEVAQLRAMVLHGENSRHQRHCRTLTLQRSHDQRMKSLTLELSFISTEALLRMTRSTSSQWKTLLPQGEGVEGFTLPTSYVILPYHREAVHSSEEMTQVTKYASLWAETIHFTSAVGFAAQMTHSVGPSREIFADYLKILDATAPRRGQRSFPSDPASVVGYCEWILARTDNAVKVLSEVLSHYLPSLSMAQSHAEKIIHPFVSQFISLPTLRTLVAKATNAREAFAALVSNVVPDPHTVAKKVVSERMAALIDVELAREVTDARECLEEGFREIVTAFCMDVVGAAIQVCAERVGRLVEVLEGEKECYLYPVDEYDGVPLGEGVRVPGYDVRELLGGMRLTVKAVCGENNVRGLAGIMGVNAKNLAMYDDTIKDEWKGFSNYMTGCWDTIATQAEYDIFNEILFGPQNSDTNANARAEISRLEMTLSRLYGDKSNFGGMKRVLAPDARTLLWTTAKNKESMDRDVITALVQHVEKRQDEATKALKALFGEDVEETKTTAKVDIQGQSTKDVPQVQGALSTESYDSEDTEGESVPTDDGSYRTTVIHPKHNTESHFTKGIQAQSNSGSSTYFQPHIPNGKEDRRHTRDDSWDVSIATADESITNNPAYEIGSMSSGRVKYFGSERGDSSEPKSVLNEHNPRGGHFSGGSGGGGIASGGSWSERFKHLDKRREMITGVGSTTGHSSGENTHTMGRREIVRVGSSQGHSSNENTHSIGHTSSFSGAGSGGIYEKKTSWSTTKTTKTSLRHNTRI